MLRFHLVSCSMFYGVVLLVGLMIDNVCLFMVNWPVLHFLVNNRLMVLRWHKEGQLMVRRVMMDKLDLNLFIRVRLQVRVWVFI